MKTMLKSVMAMSAGLIASSTAMAAESEAAKTYRTYFEGKVPEKFMKLDADSYKPGMVFQYDGIRNAGLGKPHDPNATKWVNLGSGTDIDLGFYTGYPAAPGNIKWGADHFEFVKGTKTYAKMDNPFTVPAAFTVQLAVDVPGSEQDTAYPNFFCVYDSDTGAFTRSGTYNRLDIKLEKFGGGASAKNGIISGFTGKYLTLGMDGTTAYVTQEKGMYTYDTANTGKTRPTQPWLFASGSGTSLDNVKARYLYGKFYSMRLYDHKLTEEEMVWNRFIDEVRFRQAVPYIITVDSNDARFAGAEGLGDFLLTEDHTFTVAQVTTEDGDCFEPIGYDLQVWDDENGTWGAATRYDDTSYMYNADVDEAVRTKITWIWKGVTSIKGTYVLTDETISLAGNVAILDGATLDCTALPQTVALDVNGDVTVNDNVTVKIPEGILFDDVYTIIRANKITADVSKMTLLPAVANRRLEVADNELRLVATLPTVENVLTIANTEPEHLLNVPTSAQMLVKDATGVLTVGTLTLAAVDSVLVNEGTLALGARTGGMQKWTSSVFVGAAPGDIIWRNVDLSTVVGVTGESVPGSNWGVTDPSLDPIQACHWTYAEGVATVQFQQWSNDKYLKWVVLTFTQDGPDVRCATTGQLYLAQAKGVELLGTDLAGIAVGDMVMTEAGEAKASKGAYKVRNVLPVFASGYVINGKIEIADGARLDYAGPLANAESIMDTGAIHGKTVYVAGDGPDGKGALYNSDLTPAWGSAFGRVVLTGDASAGGGYTSLRPLAGSAYEGCRLEGAHTFTIKSQALDGLEFTFYKTDFDVDKIVVETRCRLSGALTGTVTNGIHLADGASLNLSSGATIPAGIPIIVDAGARVTIDVELSAATLSNALVIGEGAEVAIVNAVELTLAGPVENNGMVTKTGSDQLTFAGPCSGEGTVAISAGSYRLVNAAIGAPPKVVTAGDVYLWATEPTTVDGSGMEDLVATTRENSKAIFSFSKTFSDCLTLENADWDAYKFVVGGSGERFSNLKLGAGMSLSTHLYHAGADVNAMQSMVEVAEGAKLTVKDGGEFHIGSSNNNGQSQGTSHHEVIVSGGEVTSTGTPIVVGYVASHGYLTMTDGTINADTIQLRLGSANFKADRMRDELYTQKGGTLNLGAGGFTTPKNYSYLKQATSYLDLVGGTLVAKSSFSLLPYLFYGLFGESEAGAYTIDLNGNNVDWYNALGGRSAVEVKGSGRFLTTAKVQNVPTGRWTVNTTPETTVELMGAAGFAGGLELKAGTTAKISMGSTNTVALAVVFNKNLSATNATSYAGAFPYRVSTMDFIHERLDQNKVIAALKTNTSTFIYRGQFYVSAEQACTWYFAASFDDNLSLEIDGARIVRNESYTKMGYGSVELAEGWHDFTIYAWDDAGSAGPYNGFGWHDAHMGLGFSFVDPTTMTKASDPKNYTRFDPTTLPMRVCDPDAVRTTVRFQKTNRDAATWDSDDCIYSARREVLTSLKALRTKADAKNLWSYANSRLTGYFYIEDAAKYHFAGCFDDLMSLRIDGELMFKTEAYNAWKTKDVTLDRGWHFFDIRVYDNGSDVGCANALKIKGGKFTEETPFDEDALRIVASLEELEAPPAGGLGGVTTLGEGATLENVSAYGICPITGTLGGSGALKGMFRFTPGSALDVTIEDGAVRGLDMTGVTNEYVYSPTMKIALKVVGRAPRTRYAIGSAYNLTDASGVAVEAVDENGTALPGWKLGIIDGRLVLVNPRPQGLQVLVR